MKRKTLILCASSFLAQLSICMINFAMLYYLRWKYCLSSSLIGIASSVYTVTYFISCIIFSSLFKILSRMQKAFIAFFGMAVSNIMILFVSSVPASFILLALYGVAMSFLWPNIEDWITEGEEAGGLAKATNSFNFSWSFGAGLSTMIGGFLVAVSHSFPIALGSFVFISIFFVLLLLNGKGDDTGKREVEDGNASLDRSTALRYFSWCGNFLNYACYALIINIFPLYALDVLGFDETKSGVLLLFRGLSACASFIVFSKVGFWQFSKTIVLLSQLFLSFLFLVFSQLTSFASLALFFALFGILFSLLYEMSIFHGASGAPEREKRMIIHEVLLNVGMVLGSSLGGIIYECISFNAILHMLSLLILFFFLIEIVVAALLSKKGLSL